MLTKEIKQSIIDGLDSDWNQKLDPKSNEFDRNQTNSIYKKW